MKIKIKSNDGFRLNLWLPTSFLKSNFIFKMIFKKSNVAIDNHKKTIKLAYKTLKKYKKENGHFTLLDVVSADGDIVKIRI